MRRPASLLLVLLAACAAPSDGEDLVEQPSIRPQPIPEPGFAFAFDRESFALTVEGAALVVRGTMSGAVGGNVTAFDATRADRGPVVDSVTEAGTFELRLEGAAPTDAIHLSFDADPQGLIALVVREVDGKVSAEPTCVMTGAARGFELPLTEVGVSKRLDLTLEAGCDQPIDIDRVHVFGDAVIAPTEPFHLEAGTSLEVAWTVLPPRVGPFQSFIVFFEGDARHVVTVRGRAD